MLQNSSSIALRGNIDLLVYDRHSSTRRQVEVEVDTDTIKGNLVYARVGPEHNGCACMKSDGAIPIAGATFAETKQLNGAKTMKAMISMPVAEPWRYRI